MDIVTDTRLYIHRLIPQYCGRPTNKFRSTALTISKFIFYKVDQFMIITKSFYKGSRFFLEISFSFNCRIPIWKFNTHIHLPGAMFGSKTV